MARGLKVLVCCLGSEVTWPQLSGWACPWLGYSFPPWKLTTVLFCFPVPNRCKKVCSHLCLLRPEGYTCACPQGSRFIEGSVTECDAGRDTAWGPGRAPLPSLVGSLTLLHLFQEHEESLFTGLLQNRVGMARKRDGRCGKYEQS